MQTFFRWTSTKNGVARRSLFKEMDVRRKREEGRVRKGKKERRRGEMQENVKIDGERGENVERGKTEGKGARR